MAVRKHVKKEVELVYYYTIGTEWKEEGFEDRFFIDSTIVKKAPVNQFTTRAIEVQEAKGEIVVIRNPEDIATLKKNDETKIYVSSTGASMTATIKAEQEKADLEARNKELEKKLAALTKESKTTKSRA